LSAQFKLSSLVCRRGVVATCLFLGAVVVLATRPGLLGRHAGSAMEGIEQARPIWLWIAAFCFLGSLLASSSSWRSALALCGGRLARTEAAARYGVGSLVNSLSPARVGEAARIALFMRALDGDDRGWRIGGVFGVISALRCLVFALVVVAGAAAGAFPLWPVLLLTALVAVAAVAAVAARERAPRSRAAHLLDAFRAAGGAPLDSLRIAGWIAAGTAMRFGGATAIATALGVHAPLTAALIIVPTLDLAGLIPLSGNLGITSGAVAMALQAHGVGISQALATGLAFHAVETAAGIAFGGAGTLLLFGRRRIFVLAGAGAAACVAAAFCATVVLPLA
jgi:uncharacterized membrane protein YbhN (UPF0104 family)